MIYIYYIFYIFLCIYIYLLLFSVLYEMCPRGRPLLTAKPSHTTHLPTHAPMGVRVPTEERAPQCQSQSFSRTQAPLWRSWFLPEVQALPQQSRT